MLMMVTNRRMTGGAYGNEEQRDFRYDFLYQYNNAARGEDAFTERGKRGFELALLAELKRLRGEQKVNTPKVGVYLHGYNNNYQESIDELFDIHQALTKAVGYAPIVVGFSWPSAGDTLLYLSDREEARDSVPAFTRFLVDLHDFIRRNEGECVATAYCIAHSMGNYLLRKGMEYLWDYLRGPSGYMMFSETLLLAPDLSSYDLQVDGKGVYITRFTRRVHVYYSKHDRALKASGAKRFGAPRLGRHGAGDYDLLPENVVVVNCDRYANSESLSGIRGRAGQQVSVHSAPRYHPAILADVAQVLSSVERDQIPNREKIPLPDGSLHAPPNHYALK